MPRSPRPWDPGSIYHVDARAHGGAPIFERDEERAFVVARAARVFREMGVDCLAWSILVNHFHLLLRAAGPPGAPMLRLNTAIARRVRERGGCGAVFQGRFFSALCTDEASFLVRLAYVTANPVHHGVVPSVAKLRRHAWSSLGESLGTREPRLVDPSVLASLLDPRADLERARGRLLALCEERARLWSERLDEAHFASPRDPGEDEPPEPIVAIRRRIGEEIGSPRTLNALAGPPLASAYDWETPAARREVLRAEGWSPDRLIPVACELVVADPDAVRRGRRARSESLARAVVAHVACDHLGWVQAHVAAAVGVSAMSVFRARSRGSDLLARLQVSAEEILRRSRLSRPGVPSPPQQRPTAPEPVTGQLDRPVPIARKGD